MAIIIIFGICATYYLYDENNKLKSLIISNEEKVVNLQSEHNSKKQELENIKEEKKDKIQRLEDIEVWNKEIVDHLK